MRNVMTIGWCLVRKLMIGWLPVLLGLGLVTQLIFLVQSGPDKLSEVLAGCRAFGLGVTFFSTTLLVIVAGSMELPREIASGTLMFVLGKPVSRWQIIVGKLFGLILLGFITIAVQTLVSCAVLTFRGLPPDVRFFLDTGFIAARIAVLSAAVVMFSSQLAELPTLFFSSLYFAVALQMNLVDYLIRFSSIDVGMVLVLRLLYYLIPNFTHLIIPTWKTTLPGVGELSIAAVYCLLYVVFLGWLTIMGFNRRDFAKG